MSETTATPKTDATNGTKLINIGLKAANAEGSAWNLAGAMILEANVFSGTTQKEQAGLFYEHWAKTIDPAVYPKSGKVKDRTGKVIDLMKDDGTPKLSAWEATKAGSKAMNEITKQTRTYAEQVPEGDTEPRGMDEAVKAFFPKGKVISGRKMRELIGKIEKDPMASIERATKLIEDCLGKDGVDPVRRDACYARLVVAFSACVIAKAA